MDYESAINYVRDDRLEIVESLTDLHHNLLGTLIQLVDSGTPPTLQELSRVIVNYISFRDNTMSMLASLDAREEELLYASQQQFN